MQTFPREDEEAKEPRAQTEDETLFRVSGLVRFIRAARTKKMIQFTDSKVQLVQKFADILGTLAPSQPFELVYGDL